MYQEADGQCDGRRAHCTLHAASRFLSSGQQTWRMLSPSFRWQRSLEGTAGASNWQDKNAKKEQREEREEVKWRYSRLSVLHSGWAGNVTASDAGNRDVSLPFQTFCLFQWRQYVTRSGALLKNWRLPDGLDIKWILGNFWMKRKPRLWRTSALHRTHCVPCGLSWRQQLLRCLRHSEISEDTSCVSRIEPGRLEVKDGRSDKVKCFQQNAVRVDDTEEITECLKGGPDVAQPQNVLAMSKHVSRSVSALQPKVVGSVP
jgi:hypothetical protein